MSDNTLPEGATLEPIQEPSVTGKSTLPPGATLEAYTPPPLTATEVPTLKPRRFESPEHVAMRARMPISDPANREEVKRETTSVLKGAGENLAGAGGAYLGGPLGGAGAYLLSKRLLEPGAISEHPIETGVNTALYFAPELKYAKKIPMVGPLMEHYGERMSASPLGQFVGKTLPKLGNWITGESQNIPTRISGPIPLESMPARVPSVGAPTLSPQQTVESAGGTYLGKGVAGHEIKLPESMTKDLPVPDSIKRNISVTVPEDKLTVANIQAAMEKKAAQFAKPLTNTQIGRNIESGVREATGTPELRPGVSLRMQPRSIGAATVTMEPPAVSRVATPSRNETLLENLKNRVPGSNPLQKGVELRAEPPSFIRTEAQPQEETVHPMTRQSIHTNGARTTELTEGKPEVRSEMINLQGEQIREVLRKSGEDMTHIQTVGKSAGKSGGFGGGKIVDPNNLDRNEALDILYDKGYTPEQILKEAPPRSKPAPIRKPFGPPENNYGGNVLVNPLKPRT